MMILSFSILVPQGRYLSGTGVCACVCVCVCVCGKGEMVRNLTCSTYYFMTTHMCMKMHGDC